MTPPAHFGLFSRSDSISYQDCLKIASSVQAQITSDWTPIWGRTGTITAYAQESDVPVHVWKVIVEDDIGQPGALGYHTDELNQPIAYVAAQGGDINQVCKTVSHEVLETIGDPFGNRLIPALSPHDNKTPVRILCEVCIAGHTKIPLLDGTEETIENLSHRESPFWVYSCNEKGRIVHGKASNARKTGESRKVLRVVLDNGEAFECTPEHRVLMRDGNYIEAQNLKVGESVMPLYRRKELITQSASPKRNGNKQYEQVFQPKLGKWEFTHRMVMQKCPKGWVRHHKDFNRFNNSPENLELMKHEEHFILHKELAQSRTAEWNKKMLSSGNHPLQKYTQTEKHKSKSRARIQAYNKSDHHRKIAAELGRKMFKSFVWDERRKAISSAGSKIANHNRWHLKRGITKPDCDLCAHNNHKIQRIEDAGIADVYDLTVEGTHNFALSCGAFVHNCDPSEDRDYQKHGLTVSDFYTPEFFDDHLLHGQKYSFLGAIPGPRQILVGGYITWVDAQGQFWQLTSFDGGSPKLSGPFNWQLTDGKSIREMVDEEVRKAKASL